MSYSEMLAQLNIDKYGKIEGVTTQKQAKMMDGIIEGKPPYVAAIEAGYGVGAARTPWKLIDASELRRRFQKVAAEKGLTLERVADKISEHMEARMTQTLQGKEVTLSEAPDYRVQQKAIEQFTGLMGIGENVKSQGAGSSLTLNLPEHVATMLAERMMKSNEG